MKKWDDNDGNKNYKKCKKHGKFYYERRNGLGIYRYQFSYENGGWKTKWVFPAIITKKNMFSLWYSWLQNK